MYGQLDAHQLTANLLAVLVSTQQLAVSRYTHHTLHILSQRKMGDGPVTDFCGELADFDLINTCRRML